jgi:hypothetical protein
MSPTLSRLVAVALAVAVGLAAYLNVVEPLVLRYQNNEDERADLTFSIERLSQVLSQRQVLLGRLKSALKFEQERPLALPHPSAALAAAYLQATLTSTAQRLGAVVVSARVLRSSSQQRTDPIVVSVRLRLDAASLQRIIYELEGASPVLVVTGLIVESGRGRRTGRQALNAEVQITGYLKSEDRPT